MPQLIFGIAIFTAGVIALICLKMSNRRWLQVWIPADMLLLSSFHFAAASQRCIGLSCRGVCNYVGNSKSARACQRYSIQTDLVSLIETEQLLGAQTMFVSGDGEISPKPFKAGPVGQAERLVTGGSRT